MERRIDVLGMGPGSKKYMTEDVYEKVEGAEVVFGNKRIFKEIDDLLVGKELIDISGKLVEIPSLVEERCGKKIVFALSGDTGYYSLLPYLKKKLPNYNIEVTPGISSVSYLFAKLSLVYQNALMLSLHNRKANFLEKLGDYEYIVLLTDNKNTPQSIAKQLKEIGYNKEIIVGEDLSHKSEVIKSYNLEELCDESKEFGINIVLIFGNET